MSSFRNLDGKCLFFTTIVLLLSSTYTAAVTVQDILPTLSLKQKIGQMTQLNIDMILQSGSTTQLDPAKMKTAFVDYGVGSIINSPYAGACGGFTRDDWRSFVGEIQAYVLANSNSSPAVPLLYGLDSVHGVNYCLNATYFPHNTGAAAMFNPSYYRQQGMITALETRTLGIPWMFSPVLGLGHQPLWSRLYETLGEDPHIGETYAAAYTQGALQDTRTFFPSLNYTPCSPCAKHYFGYSAPISGKDRTDAWIPDAYLKQYFQPSFEAAIGEGTFSVMINSGSINGIPAHASKVLLTDILRTELGMNGVAVTDWQDIEKLQIYHALAATPSEAIQLALNAGVDMSMVPDDYSFPDTLYALVMNSTIPESRLDISVTRILQMKIDLGLFTDPVVPSALMNFDVGQTFAQDIALNATRESITLLANNPLPGNPNTMVLPLTWLQKGQNILVTGPSAIDLTNLCGGWTIHWQGAKNGAGCSELFSNGVGQPIGDAVTTIATPLGITVTIFQGVNFTDYTPANLNQAAAYAASADVIIMAIGEPPESETPGSTNDLSISPAQSALYTAISSASKAPIVTVLIEPRPRVLGSIADGSSAILMGYLPCVKGGQAIAEILFGITNPSGRLPITYPRTTNDLDVYYHKPWNAAVEISSKDSVAFAKHVSGTVDPDTNPMYHDPLFPFGTGLSYSNITYSNLVINPSSAVPASAVINVTLNVYNAGPYEAKHSILVFIRQYYRNAITPEEKLLKAYTKVTIPVGTNILVTIPINISTALFYWTPTLDKVVDAGVYSIMVGNLSTDLTVTSNGIFEWDDSNHRWFLREKGNVATNDVHNGTIYDGSSVRTNAKNKMEHDTTERNTVLLDSFVDEMYASESIRPTGPLAKSVAKAILKKELRKKGGN